MADADLYTPEEIALFGASPEAIAAYRAARAIKTAANTLPAAKGMLLGEGLKGILNPTSFVTSNFLRIAGPSQFNDDTMFGRPYPMPGSVMPPITGTETANALTQEQWSNVLQENPDLLAAYTGGAGVDLGGGFILTNRGLFDSGSNRIISTPPLVPVETPTDMGGGGGSTADGGGDAGGDIGSLDPDPDLMGGDTIRAGNGWLYPNEKISSESSYPVKVHTNPDGSRVVVYSDGSERWDATSGVNPDFSKWPNRPQPSSPVPETSTRTTDEWVPIIKDWLIRFPNASEAEKQEAIQKAQEGIGTGGQGSGTANGPDGSGGSTGASGAGTGTGTGNGSGSGSGTGSGTGGLLGFNATRTTEMVFPEMYQPKLERFTVLGNLLSTQPWRYRA